jgi:uncharacterized protein YxjI
MRYLMQQKLFTFGDDYKIKDETGRERFYVDGKVFTLGDQLSFQDMQGNELAYIRQRLLTLGRTYEIWRGNELAATVHKALFTFFRCSFSIDVPGPNDLEATGDFLDYEYEIARGDKTVALVSKRWFSWSDSYGVEVADGEDDLLALASTVVIDLCCHGDRG